MECIEKFINKDLEKLRVNNYRNQFLKLPHKSLQYIIDNIDSDKAIFYIPFLDKNEIDLNLLKNFLVKNKPKYIDDKSNYSTTFRKLIVLYDKYKWGW